MVIHKIQVLQQKIYNRIYKHILFIFGIGLYDSILQKEKILKYQSGLPALKLENILEEENELKYVRNKLKTASYFVLGRIDERGRVVSSYSLQICKKVIKETAYPRKKFVIQLVVLKNGCVGVKKNHSTYSSFFRELYAMTVLGRTDIKVPQVLNYSIKKKYFIMQYIDGPTLRDIIRDSKLIEEIEAISLTSDFLDSSLEKRVELITNIEKPYIHKKIPKKYLSKIARDFRLMVSMGFLYQDIRYPNFVIYKNEIYWLDFEHCHFHPFIPASIFNSLSKDTFHKLRKFFDVDLRVIER